MHWQGAVQPQAPDEVPRGLTVVVRESAADVGACTIRFGYKWDEPCPPRRLEHNMRQPFDGSRISILSAMTAVAALPACQTSSASTYPSTAAAHDTEARRQIPDNFVGVGARGLKGDPLAAVFGAKVKLGEVSNLSFSTRPEFLVGGFDSPEWRLPFTLDSKVNEYGFAWFGGGGLAYNMDDLGKTDPMVSGGINIPLGERWVVNAQINYMWQHAIHDLDGEFILTLNYGF